MTLKLWEALKVLVIVSSSSIAASLLLTSQVAAGGLDPMLQSPLALCVISMLVLIVRYAWQNMLLNSVEVRDETPPGMFINLVGEPKLVPEKGIVMDGVGEDGKVCKVIVNPQWWRFLPGSAISKNGEDEAAVLDSVYSSVLTGTEPASLVLLKSGSQTVGFGARVSYEGCSDYLLTAHHVIEPHEKLDLCKRGKVIPDLDLTTTYDCEDKFAEFAMIKVPSNYWSRLGVGVAKLSALSKKSTVSLYGGTSSTGLTCSSGFAYKGKSGYAIVHEASTTKGWSGTPLYVGNNIVGVHTGCGKAGETNRGTNVRVLLDLSSGYESDFSEISYGEIDLDNFRLRPNRQEYLPVTIKGKGRYLLGDTDFVAMTEARVKRIDDWEALKDAEGPGRVKWSDWADEETSWIGRKMNNIYKAGIETIDLWKGTDEPVESETTSQLLRHLNCQGAGTPEGVAPPSSTLQSTDGSNPSLSPHGVCLFPKLEDRIVNLEKLVEKLLETLSSRQVKSSQSSNNTAGPSEVAKQKEDPSSSKPGGSDRPAPPPTSPSQSESSSQNTQPQQSTESSGGQSGAKKKSQRRRRKSEKQKSTQKPPQASRSPSWVKATPKS
uniref:Polyprotein P2a n=1 Tax=Lucerne transient streak virus TaxID=12470 RepID=A0A7T8JIE1_9VIRU|nr:polyprotein P2a [Lucerne transient streak virus]